MARALDLNEIRSGLVSFVKEWDNAEGYERGEAQSFVRDLLSAFGITRSRATLYEKRAKRTTTGNQGFIDALVPGIALIEMKSTGKNLTEAEIQALDYVDDLTDNEAPRYVITCDFKNFRILDLEAEPGSDLEEFTLADLPSKAESLAFFAGYRTRAFGREREARASIQAAKLMASLYNEIAKSGRLSDEQVSIFMVRLLFCLYADDAAIWPKDLFMEFLETRTADDGSDLGAQLATLFQVLNTPQSDRPKYVDGLLAQFEYVNGGIFAESLPITFLAKTVREALLVCCHFDWGSISPAVFGSLFQAVKDKKARRKLGEHYTTEANILKAIEPLFLDRLNQRFDTNYHSRDGLKALLKELSEVKIFDPACGCGNFLVVALRSLRALELRIQERLINLEQKGRQTVLINVPVYTRIDHCAGIEIDPWPARIASMALHLANHQANKAQELTLGSAPSPLPLIDSGKIEVGNALTMNWEQIFKPSRNVYVVSNPPFLGDTSRSEAQKEELKLVWGGTTSRLDYVTAWYKKAHEYFSDTEGAYAFVSTNSITQGDQSARLWPAILREGWRISFAHQTFPWTSEVPDQAAVHCVIVGLDNYKRRNTSPVLYEYQKGAQPAARPVNFINGYLLPFDVEYVERSKKPISKMVEPVRYGSKPTDDGNLIVEPEAYAEVMADPVAAKYVHMYVGSRELIHGEDRWCLWLENMDPIDYKRSKILKERIDAVKKFREASNAKSTRDYAEFSHLFRQLARSNDNFLCIPSHVSENRPYFLTNIFPPYVVASNACFFTDDPDGLQFALISSAAFMTWQKAIGGRIKSDLRFGSEITWNTFPIPEFDSEYKEKLIQAGQRIIYARNAFPERSLANHYDYLPGNKDLLKAHKKLDKLVDKLLGLTSPSEEERQIRLFELHEKMKSQPKAKLKRKRTKANVAHS